MKKLVFLCPDGCESWYPSLNGEEKDMEIFKENFGTGLGWSFLRFEKMTPKEIREFHSNLVG